MIDSQMTETVRDVDIITSEFISVNETSALHHFDSHRVESLTGAIMNNIHPDCPSSHLNAENRDLTSSSPTRFPYPLPPNYDSSLSISPERVNEVSLSVLTIDCLNKSKRS
ncbi:MAG: hypothetical protein WCF90_02780 [Methanomicrobiales archaeon]